MPVGDGSITGGGSVMGGASVAGGSVDFRQQSVGRMNAQVNNSVRGGGGGGGLALGESVGFGGRGQRGAIMIPGGGMGLNGGGGGSVYRGV